MEAHFGFWPLFPRFGVIFDARGPFLGENGPKLVKNGPPSAKNDREYEKTRPNILKPVKDNPGYIIYCWKAEKILYKIGYK